MAMIDTLPLDASRPGGQLRIPIIHYPTNFSKIGQYTAELLTI